MQKKITTTTNIDSEKNTDYRVELKPSEIRAIYLLNVILNLTSMKIKQ